MYQGKRLDNVPRIHTGGIGEALLVGLHNVALLPAQEHCGRDVYFCRTRLIQTSVVHIAKQEMVKYSISVLHHFVGTVVHIYPYQLILSDLKIDKHKFFQYFASLFNKSVIFIALVNIDHKNQHHLRFSTSVIVCLHGLGNCLIFLKRVTNFTSDQKISIFKDKLTLENIQVNELYI